MRRLRPLVALLGCAAAAAAVDIADTRFGIGAAPMPSKKSGSIIQSTDPAEVGLTIDESYSSTPGLGMSLGVEFGHLAPVGLVYGAEFRYVNGRQELKDYRVNGFSASLGSGTNSFSYAATGLAANIGLGAQFSERWHAEAVFLVGYDYVDAQSPALEVDNESNIIAVQGKGSSITRGVRVGAYWTDPDTSWQYGLQLEYTRSEGSIEASYTNSTVRFEKVSAEGLGAKATIGYRF